MRCCMDWITSGLEAHLFLRLGLDFINEFNSIKCTELDARRLRNSLGTCQQKNNKIQFAILVTLNQTKALSRHRVPKCFLWDGERVQCVKALAAKSDELNSIPSTKSIKISQKNNRRKEPTLTSCPLVTHTYTLACSCTHTCMHAPPPHTHTGF